MIMSYIEVDFDAGRRCAALIASQAERLSALPAGEQNELSGKLEAFAAKLRALSADLLSETEKFAGIDERLKNIHLQTNDKGRAANGN
jgi:hypothetical protein